MIKVMNMTILNFCSSWTKHQQNLFKYWCRYVGRGYGLWRFSKGCEKVEDDEWLGQTSTSRNENVEEKRVTDRQKSQSDGSSCGHWHRNRFENFVPGSLHSRSPGHECPLHFNNSRPEGVLKKLLKLTFWRNSELPKSFSKSCHFWWNLYLSTRSLTTAWRDMLWATLCTKEENKRQHSCMSPDREYNERDEHQIRNTHIQSCAVASVSLFNR